MFIVNKHMNLNCLKEIIKENLIVNIDLTDIKSWTNYNTGLSVTSTYKWKDAKSSRINLLDFGLTGFDNGLSKNIWDSFNIFDTDVYLNLNPVKYNIVKNPTIYETSGLTITQYNYPIESILNINNNYNYFKLNGGYLQGFFKLENYNYEILPFRYANGVTFETILHIDSDSYGDYLLIGCRSEDKYNSYYDSEVIVNIENDNIYCTGITTSERNYLHSINKELVNRKSFKNPEEMKINQYFEVDNTENIANNIISFGITLDKKLTYKYVNDNGDIMYNTSNNSINNTGFTLIDIVYMPSYNIDYDNINCENRRKGTLKFYINGRLFWKINDFNEFYFHGLYTDKEKQLSVPYSINWGGGTIGLSNSWHYNWQTYNILNNLKLYDSGFIEIENSINYYNNECYVTYSGYTGNSLYIKYNPNIKILNNRTYTCNITLLTNNLFNNNGKIYLTSYNNINIINNIVYEYNTYDDNNIINLSMEFTYNNTIPVKNIGIYLIIESIENLKNDGYLIIKNFNYKGQDILSKYNYKNDNRITYNFNKSFIGGIQKLRIYDKVLDNSEILHNTIIESYNNNDIKVNKGGRLIYK